MKKCKICGEEMENESEECCSKECYIASAF
jgi:predicted nucleic acid-binding Zn ribbon protein